MKNSVWKYILLISLLLNFSLLGAAAYARYRQTRQPPAPVGHGVRGPASSGTAAQPHLFEALSLKPEQLKLFQEKAAFFHEALDKKKAKVDRLRGSLLDMMRTDHADHKAIEATIAEISETQQEMQKRVVFHMLEFKSMLDVNQQTKFLDLINSAMATRGHMQCP